MSRPFRLVPPLLLTLCLTLAGTASAIDYNTGDIHAHGGWHSLVLSLGDARHFRAIDQQSYSDAIFSVNVSAGACDLPWLELRVALPETQAESALVNRVPADLRVDHATIHSGTADFFTERGDNGFYVHFALDDLDRLLKEVAEGELLRLRMMRGEDDPWFMVFGLAGAGEAIERVRRRCGKVERQGAT